MNSAGTAKHLLLDIGNVLVGLDYEDFGERMRALTGLSSVQLQTLLRADNLAQRFETGKITGIVFYEEACRRTGISMPWPDFLEAWNSILGPILIPEELLALLSKNVRLWIISNTNELHYDFMTRNFPFPRYVEGSILSHEVGALKPDSRIFVYALQKMQALAGEVLFVDDQAANVKAAQDLGIGAFQFLNPPQFAAELRARGIL
jgi:glucose-1-phosphatase